MNITRRNAIAGTLSMPFVASVGGGLNANAQEEAVATVIAISGVTPSLRADRLTALVGAFRDYQLPIAVCVEPRGSQSFEAEADLRRVAYFEGVEIGVSVPMLAGPSRYERFSLASRAIASVRNILGDGPVRLPLSTMATLEPLVSIEDGGELSACGIDTILRLNADLPGTIRNPAVAGGGFWINSSGVANTFAIGATSTRHWPNGADATHLGRAVSTLGGTTSPIIIELDLASLPLSGDELAAYGAALADYLVSDQVGSRRFVLPRTLREQTSPPPRRFLVVLTEIPDEPIARISLAGAFRRAGIPVTALISPGVHSTSGLRGMPFSDFGIECGIDQSVDQSIAGIASVARQLSAAGHGVPSAIAGPSPEATPRQANLLHEIGALGFKLFVAEDDRHDGYHQVGEHGLFKLGGAVRTDELSSNGTLDRGAFLEAVGRRDVAVVIVGAATLNQPALLEQTLIVLAEIRLNSSRIVTNAAGLDDALTSRLPIVGLIQRSRSQVLIVDRGTPLPPLSSAILEQDAETAWRYFDAARLGPNSAMVFGTAMRIGESVEGWPFSTMWDVGSLLLAHLEAYRIGLIAEARFGGAVVAVRDMLLRDQRRGAQRPLPPIVVDLASGQRAEDGCDAIDVGRLLVALRAIEDFSQAEFGLQRLVDGWTLGDVIRGGDLHNVSGDDFTLVQANSYAAYAAKGFRLWNFHVNDPYSDVVVEGRFDRTVEFLGDVAARGRIATEPHATEEIELGASPVTSAIIDILYSAQLQRFNDTGIVTAISEGPIDREPWFTYEGFQLDLDGYGAFVVDLSREDPRFKNLRFVEAVRRVSTKACFLLRATRPGAYTSHLHRFARSYGQNTMGFSSGISELTGRALRTSDVNNSAIILESVGHMLRQTRSE